MNKKIASIALGGLALLLGCNNMAAREDLVATVGGVPVYRSDVEFVVSTLPSSGATQSEREFAIKKILETRQRAEIARRFVGDPGGRIESRMARQKERNLAQLYQFYYLNESIGQSESDLQAYYALHRAKYQNKGLYANTYTSMRKQVAFDRFVTVHQNEIRAHFDSTRSRYGHAAQAKLVLLAASDTAKVADLLARLAKGAIPDSVVALNDAPQWRDARALPVVHEGGSNALSNGFSVLNGYLFGKAALPAGGQSPIMPSQGTDSLQRYVALHVLSRVAESMPSYDSVRTRVETDFVEQIRQNMIRSAPDSLRKAYQVNVVKIEPQGLEAYYRSHADEFKTQPAFRVYHVESSDSVKLATALVGVQTLDAFKAKAAELSSNTETRARLGDVGVVKDGHCLPFGIGMLPDLFTALQGKPNQTLTPVLKSADTGLYHVFYLVEAIAPVVKPFDRARRLVEEAMRSGGDIPLDSNAALVRMGDQVVVRELDVMKIREELPDEQRPRFNRERLVDVLTEFAIFARAARDVGLDKSPDYHAWMRLHSDRFYSQLLQDSVISATLGYSNEVLRQEYDRHAGKDSLFLGGSFDALRLDIAIWLKTPELAFRRGFVEYSDKMAGFKTWQDAKHKIFSQIRFQQFSLLQRQVLMEYQRQVPIEVLDTALHLELPVYDKDALLLRAQAAYDARKLDDAREYWTTLRAIAPADEELQRKVTLEIAKIYNDQERFEDSQREYQVYASLWPQSPEAYKALFMQGFILSENLKKDSLALPVFKNLLKRYPKTDLTDDAEWMIRNIESGGQLVPALLDSISKADSLAAPVAPATNDAVAPAPAASAPAATPAPVPATPVAQPAAKP